MRKNVIFSNLLTRVFEENIIRNMIVSLSRKGEIKVKREMIQINKFDIRSGMYIKKFDSCITLDIDEAIKYLEQNCRDKKFTDSRNKWLQVLFFTKSNIDMLHILHNEPNNQEILNRVIKQLDDS
jgi:hypothetical protein